MPNVRSPRTVQEFLHWAKRRFIRAKLAFGHGTDNALDEAAWLAGHVFDIPPEKLPTHLDKPLGALQAQVLRDLVERRIATRKPLAYLLNEAWFAGLKFYVDERVIVPRSLTAEFILERFAPWVKAEEVRTALDLCTGSGGVAIALAHAFPHLQVDATDISEEVLAVARTNVERYELSDRVHLIRSDLFEALKERRYQLIVTNPPYVSETALAALPPEYRHEPRLALAAGPEGLDTILRILAHAPSHLTPGGILIAEVGESRKALEDRLPQVPFLWLTSENGEEGVFLLTAEQLAQYRPQLMGRVP